MPPQLYEVPKTKACQSCAVAKAKCEPDTGYTKCKRCNRLNIDCILKESAPRKRQRYTPTNNFNGRSQSGGPSYSPFELERGIAFYLKSISHYFPFIEATKVYRLNTTEAPFLSLVFAMLGCTKDRSRQRALVVECRRYLGKHVVEDGQKSVDLLQGLLILVHWYHYQFEHISNQRALFLHMAMAMAVDLELNKPTSSRSSLRKFTDAAKCYEVQLDGIADHTFEEKRVFLGCLYLTSVLSKCSMNMDGIKFSEYAEKCCESLEASTLPSDRELCYLLRLQQIIEQFEHARAPFTNVHRMHGFIFNFNYNTYNRPKHGSVLEFVDQWTSVLEDYWNKIPASKKTDILSLQYHYAKVGLHEICLEESAFASPSERANMLYRCLNSIASLHEIFIPFSRDPMIFMDIPSHIFAQSNHGTFVAIQLCSVRCEGWSPTAVEKRLYLVDVFDRTMKIFDDLLTTTDNNEIPEFFLRLAPMAKSIKGWWQSRLCTIEDGEAKVEEEAQPEQEYSEADFEFLGQFLNLDDNTWLQNMLVQGGFD
ncbi:hypothetical protein K491DRAFT_694980 [Lophiostoma macrostomum CBS 122681]|uniref:Zn(2)-C6 fungal-type domain-containing protein n=1 Tax=Lophiostoma macrostomum CBS 122681 TaxID=1314788 RepID=A0A6A6T175_9PLEO|nr:hypothetical protein K491DRAFT_694980 [Lophiostoma macrostomum CBS 122681]